MTRVALDANILLSATVGRPDGPPSVLLDAARSGEIEMVACEELLGEVSRGLASSYFRHRVGHEEAVVFVAMLRAVALMAPNPIAPLPVLRDPSDDYLVALARAAHAEAIITGDRDLLEHEGLQPPAHTARDGCARLGLLEA